METTNRTNRENALLYIGFFVALLPAVLLRDFTPSNELRYLSIADEALQNHTLFAFTNHGLPYADKPPLYLWFVMLCRWLTGEHHMWLLSLFSAVPAVGIVHVMDAWTRSELSDKGRTLAKVMLLTSGLFLTAALTLRMDMLMSLFIVLALREFWRMWSYSGSARSRWLFPVYLFLAVFTKGPLGLLIPLVGTAVFLLAEGNLRQFGRYWGWRTWAVLLGGCALWFGAAYLEGGADYLNNLLVHQTVGRAVHSFRHNEPFYYYLVSIWYSLAPWSLLVIGGLVASLRPRFVRSSMQRLFLAVALSAFVMLSCISSKLQIYFLPAIPFLVYASAMSLARLGERWQRLSIAIPAGIFALALPGLVVAAQFPGVEFLNEKLIYAAAGVLSVAGIYTVVTLYRQRHEGLPTAIRTMGVGMLMALYMGGMAMPRLNSEIGYGKLCSTALELSLSHGITEVLIWDVPRWQNMDIYLHSPLTITHTEEPPLADANHPFVLLTRKRDLDQFPGKETAVVGRFAVVLCQ